MPSQYSNLESIHLEKFVEKIRIARKSGQKIVTINITEAAILEEALSMVMIRLAGNYEDVLKNLKTPQSTSIKFDGGGF